MDNASETTILIGILKCTLFFGWQAVDTMLCLTTVILVSVVTVQVDTGQPSVPFLPHGVTNSTKPWEYQPNRFDPISFGPCGLSGRDGHHA